jgi:peptidoglycan lytic transglycosylase G
MRYRQGSKYKSRLPKRVWLILVVIVIAAIFGTALAVHIYNKDLAPVSSSQSSQIFTVTQGSSVKEIGAQLQDAHLIRSAWAFELYLHAKNLTDKLQAGTYDLSPSYSLSHVVSILTQGRVTTKLVTIVPGSRIDQVRAALINSGFSPASVDAALNPSLYPDLPVMAFKPASANNLEGLLWPDSFQKDASTDPSTIIRESLTEAGQHLTPAVQQAFASEGLNTYQGLILTSMVLQEVSKPSDQAQVAQVFLSRLKANMDLGSDASARYGAIETGQAVSNTVDTPFNTYLHAGLPPTPIGTVDAPSLYAATHPANTNWLYFVSGDNGTTYFSTDAATHQQQVQQYCHQLCGQ